jgi:hypothetical protein
LGDNRSADTMVGMAIKANMPSIRFIAISMEIIDANTIVLT